MGSSSQEMFMSESAAIRKIAKDGPCIFLGRSADYALRKYDNVFSIFVCADDAYREARGKTVYDVSKSHELNCMIVSAVVANNFNELILISVVLIHCFDHIMPPFFRSMIQLRF